MNPDKILKDFEIAEMKGDIISKISKEQFKSEVLPLIMDETDNEAVVRGWEYIAGGVQLPISIVDDNGVEIIRTPALYDTMVIYDKDEAGTLNDNIGALSTDDGVSRNKIGKTLRDIGDKITTPKWKEVFDKLGISKDKTHSIADEYPIEFDV